MQRDSILFIEDMFNAIQKIEDYTKTFGLQNLNEQGVYYDAVLRNLEILGRGI